MTLLTSRIPRALKNSVALFLGCAVLLFSWSKVSNRELSQYASQYVKLNIGAREVPKYVNFASASDPGRHTIPGTPESEGFWRAFSRMLAQGDPGFILKTLASSETPGWVSFDGIREDSSQPDLLNMSEEVTAEFSKLHAKTVEEIKLMTDRIPFVPGTRGIVTTAGPTADAMLATSLRMLRKSGSRLPVEIWLYDETDHDQYMCDVVWKSLGATCMLITDFLSADTLKTGENPLVISQHFQMKILAILFSSFEQTLFMDCDLFPLNNPDSIFVTEPFTSKGFVLWPDYWANTNSPSYAKIVDRPQSSQYERQSTESGAMLVNKATHAPALLLSAYYNRYGPDHWYWLFSQGAIGHGDKDTYLPAIQYFDLPFYQVDTPPRRVGYRCLGNERAIGSAQHHPLDDWLITSQNLSRAHGNLLSDIPVPRTLFIHGNLPKNDPVSLMNWFIPEAWEDQLKCGGPGGTWHRQWGKKEFNVLFYGYDAEKALWDQMRWLACTHDTKIRRWTEGLTVDCTEAKVAGGWCPPESLGSPYLFEKPAQDVCNRFIETYEGVLPGEIYDPDLPLGGLAERPWSSLAGSTAL